MQDPHQPHSCPSADTELPPFDLQCISRQRRTHTGHLLRPLEESYFEENSSVRTFPRVMKKMGHCTAGQPQERGVVRGVTLPHKPQLGPAFIPDRRAISRATSLFGDQEGVGLAEGPTWREVEPQLVSGLLTQNPTLSPTSLWTWVCP